MKSITSIFFLLLLINCSSTNQDNKAIDKTISSDNLKTNMSDTLKADILEQVNTSIKSGFYDKDDIFNNIEDYLYEIPFDREWTKQQIEKMYTAKLKEQDTWPAVTDFDKLTQAFDKLNRSGIISLHNAGITKQDGESDCEEIYRELKEKGIVAKGYCYYHWQDIEGVVTNGNLFIGFGDFKNNDKDALAAGNQIALTLENFGLKLNWDKTINTRIEIINLQWQKRFGNNNCSNDRAIKKLSEFKN